MQTSILKKRNSIIIQYRVNGKQFRIFTGISVNDSEWNKRSKSVIGESSKIISSNQLIKSYQDAVESYLYDLKRNGASYNHEQLKTHITHKLTAKLKVKNKIDVFYAFELFIKNKKTKYSPLTITAYNNTLSHLKDFCKNGNDTLAFEELNLEWFEKFTFYLKDKLNHSPNTRGNQIKNIKAVLNYAHELELHNYTKYHFVKKEKENYADIYLSETEIEQLSTTELNSKIERKFIDTFIFICLTGLRFSDYSKISKENFKQIDNYWYLNFQQKKTKKEVSVPIIYKKACDILIQYDFNLPKYTNAYFNRRLKSIFLEHKLFSEKLIINKEGVKGISTKRELITVHTGRRSFATNQFLKNTPISLIMAATGHETEKAFRTYIKATEIEKSKGLISYADY
jgi:integrase